VARRIARPHVLVFAAAVVLIGLQFVPTDTRRITSLLNGLCADLNQTRDAATLAQLDSALRGALAPQVLVNAPEVGESAHGPDAVVVWSRDLLTGAPLSFSLSDTEVQVQADTARVTTNLLATVRGSGEQHRDLRYAVVDLQKAAGNWRITQVIVDPVRPAQPEARP
jgi:hypothetical protein